MIAEVIKQYGDQIFDGIELILFIILVIGIFMGGPIGTIISNLADGLC